MAILHISLLRQELGPLLLNVIQHKRHELHFVVFSTVLLLVHRLVWLTLGIGCPAAAGEQRKKVLMKNQTEYTDDDDATDAEMRETEAATSSAASAAIVTAVFNVTTDVSRSPFHN